MKRTRKIAAIGHSFFVLIVFFFINNEASLGQVTTGSVSASTGGTGRAAVAAGDSVVLNPAMLYHLRGYIFYSAYQPGESLFAISDNTRETIIPTAFTFSTKENFQNFRLTLADHVYKGVSMGLSLHYSQYREGLSQAQQWNADLGFSYLPTRQLGLGLVFYNLQGPSKEIPMGFRSERNMGLGAAYLYRNFLRWRFDVLSGPNNNLEKLNPMIGMESFLNKWMLLRIGYRENLSLNQKYATTGIGFDYPRFTFNYAYEAELEKEQNKRHSVDLAVPF